jgi:Ca2+-transporting ATPase
MAFSGTLVVRGQAEAVVVATGAKSAIGKIGGALAAIRTETPRLRQETRRIVRIVAVAAVAVSLLAGIAYGLAQNSAMQGLLSGIAVSMSLLPEEFPLVLAVFTVMGAWRIARARVLTRRAASIETLGAVTVLCTDKTGTLTQNKMQVAHIETPAHAWRPGGEAAPPADVGHLMRVAMLAGLPEPFDPMERAMQSLMQAQGREPAQVFAERELAHRQGITPELLAMTQVWRRDGAPAQATTKGAPEAVLSLCAVPEPEAKRILARAGELAAEGLRVLAVAEAETENGANLTRLMQAKFAYLGLVGFADPVRDSVPPAVRECARAGIRVVMITGDFPETARAIASQAGLDAERVLTGAEIKQLGDAALRERVRDCDIFARILPDQKLRIVEALKANGEVVGMTGDGVNDAPSLRAAHIGIAMGGRGTDVAREASSIVLLDDDFGSIVWTIRLGRRIYDNLQKAMGYILSVHVPIAGLALLPLAFGAPPILTPAIIAFLEMIIDPACSIVFEAEHSERRVMQRPPRDPNARLLSRAIVVESVAQGAAAFLVVAGVYAWALAQGRDEADLRALMLITVTLANVALIFAHRSLHFSLEETFERWNPWLWFGLAGVAAILSVILLMPPAREVLRLGVPHLSDLVVSAAAMLALGAALLAAKYLREPRAAAPS